MNDKSWPVWKNFTLHNGHQDGTPMTATVSVAQLSSGYLLQIGGEGRHMAERLFPAGAEEEALVLLEKISLGATLQELDFHQVLFNPKKKNIGIREEKRVLTPDNWCPTAEDGKVRVTFTGLMGPMWRVCVWGEDDLGVERDYPDDQREQAWAMYESIGDGITIDALLGMGLEYA